MKCQTCHLPATVQYTFFARGQRGEVCLCERCAQKNEEIRKARADAERVRRKLTSRIPLAKPADATRPLEYRPAGFSGESAPWFSVGKQALRCAFCRQPIEDKNHTFDLKLKECPHCGEPCLLFAWVDHFVQIIPQYAPPSVREFLALAQSLPSEQEATEMLSCLQDLFNTLRD